MAAYHIERTDNQLVLRRTRASSANFYLKIMVAILICGWFDRANLQRYWMTFMTHPMGTKITLFVSVSLIVLTWVLNDILTRECRLVVFDRTSGALSIDGKRHYWLSEVESVAIDGLRLPKLAKPFAEYKLNLYLKSGRAIQKIELSCGSGTEDTFAEMEAIAGAIREILPERAETPAPSIVEMEGKRRGRI